MAIKAREEKIKQIEAHREQSKAERENMRSAIASKKEEIANAEPVEGEEGEPSAAQKELDALEAPVTPEDHHKPIEVPLDADSDDDFSPIEIKEKVRAHFKEHGLTERVG